MVVTVQFHAASRLAAIDAPADTVLDEGDFADLRVRLIGAPPQAGSDITVHLSVGGDVESGDYSAPSSGASVTFTAADYAPKTVRVTTVDDRLNEAAETLVVTIAAADEDADVVVSHSMAAVALTIAQSDPVTYSIAAGAAGVTEGGEVELIVRLSGLSEGDISVPLTLGGTAAFGEDFSEPAGGAHFLVRAGTIGIEKSVEAIDDTLNEAAETFLFTAGATPTLGAGAGQVTLTPTESGQSAGVTVADNDPVTVSVAAAAATVSEGATARITLSGAGGALSGDLTLTYAIGDAPGLSVISAADYSDAGGGEVTFAPAATPYQIALDILSDLAAEPQETLVLTLTSAATVGAASVSGSAAPITIAASAAAQRTLTVTGPAAVTETDANQAVNYIVDLTGTAFSGDTELTWTVAPGATRPTAAGDFAATTGTFRFPTVTTFAVTLAGDTDNEATETFSVQIAAGDPIADGGSASGAAQATAITDNDDIEVAFSVVQPASLLGTVAENGGVARVRVALSGGTRSDDVTVPFTLGGLDAAEFNLAAATGVTVNDDGLGGVVVFEAGAGAGDFIDLTFTMVGDSLNEPARAFTVAGADGLRTAGAIDYATGGRDALVIVADDDAVNVSFERTAVTITEGGTADLGLILSGASAGSVTVAYSVTAGGGTSPQYTASAHPVIAAGDTSAAIGIATPIDGNVDSGSGTLTVRITAVTTDGGGVVTVGTPAQAVVTVNFIDQARGLTLSGPAAVTESDADQALTFRVTRSGDAFDAATTVSWAIRHAATAGTEDADFTATGGSIEWGAAATTGEFTVTLAGDNLNEAAEHFTVQLSVPAALATDTAIGAGVAVAVADDDDLTITFPAAATVTEGESLSVSARISGAEVNGEVELTWASAAATADAAEFIAGGGTLSVTDAADPFEFSVQTIEDSAAEAG
ncbi:MAG: hypothetical protein OXU22_00655, partial [Gammaproteobacteria bacterium]|nr:hypothetical protein [Gammaproteobacteria bacterium]